MPRTKKKTVKQSSSECNATVNATIGNQPKNIKEILNEFESESINIEVGIAEQFENYKSVVENSFLFVKMNMGNSLKMNFYDYIAQCNTKKSNNVASSASKKNERPENNTTRHESASTVITSKMYGSSTVTKTKHNSDIRHNDGTSLEIKESKFITPANKPIPVFSSVTITPKMNINEPISMMRRPNQGEVALSMTGSPLMVSSVSRDDMATVSVPLANGNVLSILPRVGASMDVSFNEQTKSELLLLKGNIEGLLNKKRHI